MVFKVDQRQKTACAVRHVRQKKAGREARKQARDDAYQANRHQRWIRACKKEAENIELGIYPADHWDHDEPASGWFERNQDGELIDCH